MKVFAIAVLLSTLLMIRPSTQTTAHFTIAAWEFPDEYGQGIHYYALWENSTGTWEPAGIGGYNPTTNTAELWPWNASLHIRIRVGSTVNQTLTGATGDPDARNYFQHNVTVVNRFGEMVFSKQNFTFFYYEGVDDGIMYYIYDVVLEFTPEALELYTITLMYEVWY